MVSTMLRLREYQKQAIAELFERWKEVEARRLAIVLPTGGGKTVVFAHLSKQVLDAAPHGRVLVLVHTDELVRQAVEKINHHAPNLITGVIKAKENETTADVIVASVQTLRNPRRMAQVRDVVTVIVDECHHAAAKTYMSILTHFGCFRVDGARAVGFTATLARGDSKSLGSVWQDVAFERDISWMIRKKYLIPPRGLAVVVPDLNLRDVKATRADYREGELGEALAESLAPELVVKSFIENASDRKALAFFPTVDSAYVFAQAFDDAGIQAEVIHGGLSQDERDAIKARHKRGGVLVNCMVLTEGYDDPEIDCVIIGRPTKSKPLYIQIVGRGLRVDPARPYEEQDCLLLDVVGANATHDLRSIVDLSEKKIDPEKAGNGRSLIELEDEFDAGEGIEEDAPNLYTGPVDHVEFDPLGRSSSSKVWIKTDGGTFFVPAGKDAYVFIMEWPKPGTWSVAWAGKSSNTSLFLCDTHAPDGVPLRDRAGSCCTPRNVATTPHRGLPLEEAMSWAEDLATDMGANSLNAASRKAPWRRATASQKMVDLAKSLGISASTADTAGKVSDRITKVMGTKRLDPLVRSVKR